MIFPREVRERYWPSNQDGRSSSEDHLARVKEIYRFQILWRHIKA